ncbi:MAG: FAD:protein FMN transferase [Clostridia bacterium]|nr:FAD:protein FMN transferase [Clostridia bacterium]
MGSCLKNLPKKVKGIISILSATVFCVFCLSACSFSQKTGVCYLGSFLSADVILYLYESVDNSVYERVERECKNAVSEAEAALSTKVADSDVSRFNALSFGERTAISKTTKRLIESAKNLYSTTGGAFDPATYSLVDLWGFSSRFDEFYTPTKPYDRQKNAEGSFPLPDRSFVEAFKELTDFSLVEIVEEGGATYLKKNCPSITVGGTVYDQQIDLSGIAKGYLSDALKTIILSAGIKDFYLSLGTSSLYLGSKNGEAWNTELVDPSGRGRSAFASIPLLNKSVSTSGTYEHSYTLNGKKYHHIIDAESGAPSDTDLLSAVVIGGDGEYADALSTALVVLGSEKALEFIADNKDFDFVLLTDGGKVYSTVELTLINKEYELIAV